MFMWKTACFHHSILHWYRPNLCLSLHKLKVKRHQFNLINLGYS